MTTDQRVLKLWAGGYSSIEIAERLGITVSHVTLIVSSTIGDRTEQIQSSLVSRVTCATEQLSPYGPQTAAFRAAA